MVSEADQKEIEIAGPTASYVPRGVDEQVAGSSTPSSGRHRSSRTSSGGAPG
jgi:hypothetical protein